MSVGLALLSSYQGDYEAASLRFDRCLDLQQAYGDRAGEALTWHQLATIDLARGDYEAAGESFRRSLEIKQAIGDRAGEAATWHQLATIDLARGDYEAAGEQFRRALEILAGDRRPGRRGEATWHQLASIDFHRGDYEAAGEQLPPLPRDRAGDRQPGRRGGHLARAGQHRPPARRLRGGRRKVPPRPGDPCRRSATGPARRPRGTSWPASTSGEATTRRPARSSAAPLRSSRRSATGPARRPLGTGWPASTWSEATTRRPASSFRRSLEILQAIGDRAGESATWHQLASIDLRRGDYAAAGEQFRRALESDQAIGNRAGEAATWAQLGIAAFQRSEHHSASRCLAIAFGLASSVGTSDVQVIAKHLSAALAHAEIPEAQFQSFMQETAEQYQRDRGTVVGRASGHWVARPSELATPPTAHGKQVCELSRLFPLVSLRTFAKRTRYERKTRHS